MNLYPGTPVLYRWRPGQIRGGNYEAAAQILAIRAGNVCDLIIHPAGAREPMYFEGVPMQAKDDQTHCWRLPPVDERVVQKIAALEQQISDLEGALTGGRAPAKKSKPGDYGKQAAA